MNNPLFTMPKVRILVADASRARFFRVESPTGELIEESTETNPEARLHPGDLVTDSAGEQRSNGGEGRGAMNESSEPKDVEVQRFARQISEKLEKERTSGIFEKLYLVAPPRFLGELRNYMKPSLKATLVEEINKDLSSLDAKQLRKQLPERLK